MKNIKITKKERKHEEDTHERVE